MHFGVKTVVWSDDSVTDGGGMVGVGGGVVGVGVGGGVVGVGVAVGPGTVGVGVGGGVVGVAVGPGTVGVGVAVGDGDGVGGGSSVTVISRRSGEGSARPRESVAVSLTSYSPGSA